MALDPGAGRDVAVTVEPRAFSYWSVERRTFRVEAGSYEIRVAASSRDVRLRGRVDMTARDLR